MSCQARLDARLEAAKIMSGGRKTSADTIAVKTLVTDSVPDKTAAWRLSETSVMMLAMI